MVWLGMVVLSGVGLGQWVVAGGMGWLDWIRSSGVERGLDPAEPAVGLRVPEAGRVTAGLGEVEVHLAGRPRGHGRLDGADAADDGSGWFRAGGRAAPDQRVVRIDRGQGAVAWPGPAHLPADVPDLNHLRRGISARAGQPAELADGCPGAGVAQPAVAHRPARAGAAAARAARRGGPTPRRPARRGRAP